MLLQEIVPRDLRGTNIIAPPAFYSGTVREDRSADRFSRNDVARGRPPERGDIVPQITSTCFVCSSEWIVRCIAQAEWNSPRKRTEFAVHRQRFLAERRNLLRRERSRSPKTDASASINCDSDLPRFLIFPRTFHEVTAVTSLKCTYGSCYY